MHHTSLTSSISKLAVNEGQTVAGIMAQEPSPPIVSILKPMDTQALIGQESLGRYIQQLNQKNKNLENKLRVLRRERCCLQETVEGLQQDLYHAIEQLQLLSCQQKQDKSQHLWHNHGGSLKVSWLEWGRKFRFALRNIVFRENSTT